MKDKALLNASKGAKIETEGTVSVNNAAANFNDTVTIGNGLKAENGARIMVRNGGEISGTVTVKGEKTLAFLDGVTVRKGSVIEALSKGQININGGKTEKNHFFSSCRSFLRSFAAFFLLILPQYPDIFYASYQGMPEANAPVQKDGAWS